MNDKLREFQAELERLHRAEQTAKRKDKAEALAAIQALIAEWDLTTEDFGFTTRAGKLADAAPPKYRDPVTGATWSGKGRPPGWLHGKDRAQFEI